MSGSGAAISNASRGQPVNNWQIGAAVRWRMSELKVSQDLSGFERASSGAEGWPPSGPGNGQI